MSITATSPLSLRRSSPPSTGRQIRPPPPPVVRAYPAFASLAVAPRDSGCLAIRVAPITKALLRRCRQLSSVPAPSCPAHNALDVEETAETTWLTRRSLSSFDHPTLDPRSDTSSAIGGDLRGRQLPPVTLASGSSTSPANRSATSTLTEIPKPIGKAQSSLAIAAIPLQIRAERTDCVWMPHLHAPIILSCADRLASLCKLAKNDTTSSPLGPRAVDHLRYANPRHPQITSRQNDGHGNQRSNAASPARHLR